MGLRALLLIALLLPTCTFAPPLPMDEWDVPFDPLYRPAVWIETDEPMTGGGVIVASAPELGTVILTAHHVVRGADRVLVGVFRHSRVDGAGPEYVLYPAEIVAAGFLLDERIAEPIRELAEAYGALLDAADSPGRFPGLEAQRRAFDDAVRRIESARDRAGFIGALDRVRRGLVSLDTDEFGTGFRAAMRVVSEKRSEEEGTRLGRRIPNGLEALLDAMKRFGRRSAAGYDAALLRIRTSVPHHAARCRFATAGELAGARGKLVTIQPDRQPRVRPVRIQGDADSRGSSELTGLVELGNSGSPVFVDGRLVGVITDGLFPVHETPGDRFEEAVYLRIRTVRAWLARRGLEYLLR